MITKDIRIIFGGVPKETSKGPVVNVRQALNIPIIRPCPQAHLYRKNEVEIRAYKTTTPHLQSPLFYMLQVS